MEQDLNVWGAEAGKCFLGLGKGCMIRKTSMVKTLTWYQNILKRLGAGNTPRLERLQLAF